MGDIVASLSFFTISTLEEEEVPAIKPVEAGDGLSPDFLLVLLRRDLTTGVLELVGDISAGLVL